MTAVRLQRRFRNGGHWYWVPFTDPVQTTLAGAIKYALVHDYGMES